MKKQIQAQITYKGFDKLILFGGSFLMASLVRRLQKEKFSIVVFSAERHLDGIVTERKETLRKILTESNVRFFGSENINQDKNLLTEITPQSLGIALGAAWLFDKETVSLFKSGHLIDFMGVDLPRYRGGAHYSWQILHDNRKGSANLQIILGGKETFHRGPVISSEFYDIPKTVKTPLDYFNFLGQKENDMLVSFIKTIKKGSTFNPRFLDEGESSFYPPLSTMHHGFIDWSWTGEEICLFVRAFDEPYFGASTFILKKRVFLKNVEIQKAEEKYHPFTSGLVVRKTDKEIFVATMGALLRIGQVFDEKGKDILQTVNSGFRFHTPRQTLDDARSFVSDYNPSGLSKK